MRLSNFRVPAVIAGLSLLAGTTAAPIIAAPFTYNHRTVTHVNKRSDTPTKTDQSLEVVSSFTKLLKNETLERRIGSSISGKPSYVPSLTANASGCWSISLADKMQGIGFVQGTYGMVGRWCHNGQQATSGEVVDAYGETSTPGWNYNGHEIRYLNVGWETRMIVKYKFTYGVPTKWGTVSVRTRKGAYS